MFKHYRHLKKVLIPVLTAAFMAVFSVASCRPAWAASEVSPVVYLLNVASYACGMVPVQHPAFWLDAYKGYCEYIGDATSLNQIKHFESLSWGDTVTGMDAFTKNLKNFFAKYVDYQGEWVPAFKFPCKKRSFSGFITDTEDRRISGTPYADVFSTPPSGYQYLYSDWYAVKETSGVNAGRIYNVKRNFFAPSGSELVGFYSVGFYDKAASINFYRWSPSKNKVVLVGLKFSSSSYWVDTGECFSKGTSVSGETFDGYFFARDMTNFPVKVFSHTGHMTNYFSNNGEPFVYSSPTECVLFNGTPSYGEYIKEPLAFVSDSIVLPSDSSAADTALKGFLSNSSSYRDSIYRYLGLLADYTSFTVGYPYEYIINYMYDGVQDGTATGIASTHDLMVSSVELQPKAGYRLASVPYTPALPAVLSDGANTITVNYESFNYPYTVQYYYDGALGDTKEFSISSLTNTVTSVPEAPRTGYRLAADPYTPALPAAIDDTNNVIKVNYESWEYSYTVQYYYDNVLKERKELSVPSYDNVVQEVPLLEGSGIYKLSESPYSPDLPFTVDDQNHVLKVLYVSPTSQAVTKQVGGVFQGVKHFIVSAFPVLIGLVLVVFLIVFVVKWYKRYTQKG